MLRRLALTTFALLAAACGSPCAEPGCADCYASHGRAVSAERVRVADGLLAAVDDLEARLVEQCQAFSRRLDVSVDASIGGCLAVASEVETRVGRYVPDGVRLNLAIEPTVCQADPAIAEACAEGCGLGDVAAACVGEPVGECAGTCTGTCHGRCGDTCDGTCSDFCVGVCDGACDGDCEGACQVLDAYGYCVVECDGVCQRGSCDGDCHGACTGRCTEACDEACEGVCLGECDAAWSPSCDGRLELGDSPCAEICEASAALATACALPEVRVRGPELEEPRFHGLVDQVVIAVRRRFPELLQIDGELARAIEAELDRLEATLSAWAETEPAACVLERAPALSAARPRVEAMRAALDALFTAARDTVGTAL